MKNRIMYNYIYRCMMRLHYGATVYTLGYMNVTAIIGNYIHESSGYKGIGYDKVMISGYQSEVFENLIATAFQSFKGVTGGIYLDEGSIGINVCGNLLHDLAVHLYYHNQIDLGYTRVWFRENILNKKR